MRHIASDSSSTCQLLAQIVVRASSIILRHASMPLRRVGLPMVVLAAHLVDDGARRHAFVGILKQASGGK
jgi:hypothetical protein